jgi:hypothetical protein
MTDRDVTLTEVQYTRDDHVAAYRLHGAPTRRAWLVVALILTGLVALLYIFDSSAPLWIAPLAVIGGFAGGLFSWAVYLPWIARRNFRRYPLAHLRTGVALLPEGIRTEGDRGKSTVLWKDFIQWRANKRVVLVYLSPRLFLFFPTWLAAKGFPIDELKAALTRELGPPKR